MAMTTRCPHCGTAFKVVADQLRVRNGLVRCGVCSRVFDGHACVVEGRAATSSPPVPQPDAHPEVAPDLPPAASPVLSIKTPAESPPAAYSPLPASPPSRPQQQPGTPVQQPYTPRQQPGTPLQQPDTPLQQPDTPVQRPYIPPPQQPGAQSHQPYIPPQPYTPPISPEPAVLRGRDDSRRVEPEHRGPVFPSYDPPSIRDADEDEDVLGDREPYAPYRQDDVDDAEQQARDMALPRDDRFPIYAHRDIVDKDEPDYIAVPGEARTRYDDLTDAGMAPPIFMNEEVQRRRTLLGRLWAVGCLLALIVLGLQCIYIYRTSIATAIPALHPAFEAACAQLGCQLGYARRLERISITASSLQPQSGAASDDGLMRLTLAVTLRNRYDKPQPWPALMLQLTDLSDTVVVRKVLLPENYLPPGTRGPFPAGGEQSLSVPLQVDGLHVNGYQLDKFFP
jgi:predicted Zn finger-like uncharacterized protein